MPIIIPQRFSQRYDTVTNWTAKNPVLWAGEIAYGTDGTGKVVSTKVGDGTTSWTGLPEAGGGGVPSGGTTGQIIVKQSATDGDAAWQDPLIQSAGTGIDITSGVISSTLGSIALSGYPATYSTLPTGLGSGDAGKAYMVKADGLVYIWDGSAWPANGSGEQVGPLAHAKTSSSATLITASASIPQDNTLPQKTEGAAITMLDTTITPKRADSQLRVDIFFPLIKSGAAAAGANSILALFRDSGSNAVAVFTPFIDTPAASAQFTAFVPSVSTASTTFTLRIGGTSSGNTFYINRTVGSAALFGGGMLASMEITEFMP